MRGRLSRKRGAWIGALFVLGLVAATAIPGLAAPSGAKYFAFTVTPASVSGGTEDQVFSVTITNTSPTGSSSNTSSMSITLPPELVPQSASVAPRPASSNTNASAVVAIDSLGTSCQGGTSQTVNVCSTDPLKRMQKIRIDIVADVTGTSLSCGANTSGAWDVAAYTGSQLNGDSFDESPVNPQPYTTIDLGCFLEFDPEPTDAPVNTDIPVGVSVVDSGGNPVPYAGSVTLAAPGTTVTPATDTSEPFAFTVNGSAAGQYTATASSTGLTSITADFTLFSTDSSISGQKWRDHDNDGTRDDDEQGIAGWTISAFDADGGLAGTDSTNAAGDYTIDGLSAGQTYTVCEFAPAEDQGFGYRGWLQSVPTGAASADLCADVEGAEPNGYSVTIAGPAGEDITGKDFFNVRTITIPGDTITVTCDPAPPAGGQVYTVGDGITEPKAEVTVYPDGCKPGEYVFESWISDGEQTVAFYPTFPKTNVLVPIEQHFEWVIDGDKAQSNLYYDDDVPGVPERIMLFCNVDAQGDFSSMPDPVAPDTADHTTCLMSTTELATSTGVFREDTTITLVDGTVRRK